MNREQWLEELRRGAGADLPDLFAVISWGCAATKWTATTLNAHPRVLCVHALQVYEDFFRAPGARLNDVDYLSMLQLMAEGHALVGDVHGINRSSVPRLKEHFGERFRAAALVRDPQGRLASQLSLFERHGYDENFWSGLDYLRHLDGFAAVARHYRDKPKRFFMHAVHLLNSIHEEQQHCRVFRTEDLTARPEAVVELVSYLSGGKLVPTPQWACDVVERPAVNRHNTGRRPGVTEPWQFEVLHALLRPESRDAYRALGYSLPGEWQPQKLAS